MNNTMNVFVVRFSKGSDDAIHLSEKGARRRIRRVIKTQRVKQYKETSLDNGNFMFQGWVAEPDNFTGGTRKDFFFGQLSVCPVLK